MTRRALTVLLAVTLAALASAGCVGTGSGKVDLGGDSGRGAAGNAALATAQENLAAAAELGDEAGHSPLDAWDLFAATWGAGSAERLYELYAPSSRPTYDAWLASYDGSVLVDSTVRDAMVVTETQVQLQLDLDVQYGSDVRQTAGAWWTLTVEDGLWHVMHTAGLP